MWSWEKRSSAADQKRIEELEQQVRVLEANNSALKATVEQFESKYRTDLETSTFAFDFDQVKAFSVERVMSGAYPQTIIGYLLPTDGENEIVKEWYFNCSHEQHEALVVKFNNRNK
jgi:uncharacterized protein (DUF3084 family)